MHTIASWPQIKQIPTTDLLINADSSNSICANFEIIDISNLPQGNKPTSYKFEEISRDVGEGDLSVNANRAIAALIPVRNRVSYRLFDCNTLEITRKARWHPDFQHCIASLDFDPLGKTIGIIDWKGVFLLSDVDTNDVLHVSSALLQKSSTNRYRWSPLKNDPTIFLKHSYHLLNLMNVEKRRLILEESLKISDTWLSYAIDPTEDGNLLVASGDDKSVHIFDRKVGKIVKSFKNLHTGRVYAVKWSRDGTLIATGSDDHSAKIVDLRAEGKPILTLCSNASNQIFNK